MDSPWFYQTSAYTGSSSHNQEDIGNSVDLTLKLGCSGDDQLPDPDLNLNLNLGLYNHQHEHTWDSTEGVQGFGNFYTTNLPGGLSSNGYENPWPFSLESSGVGGCMNNAMGYGPPNNLHSCINGFNHPTTSSPVYTPLDSTPKNNGGDHDRDMGSSSSYRRSLYNDPNKRCTNCFCTARETPMWRRGPQGPKTLCNACGIKFRKEEERKARERTNKWNKQQHRNG